MSIQETIKMIYYITKSYIFYKKEYCIYKICIIINILNNYSGGNIEFFKETSLTLAAICIVLTFGPELGFVNNQAKAAEFPTKPIKVYVGFKPGGRTDMIARLIANHITEKKLLSQPIVIVNKPGAVAANAARAVLAAKPRWAYYFALVSSIVNY